MKQQSVLLLLEDGEMNLVTGGAVRCKCYEVGSQESPLTVAKNNYTECKKWCCETIVGKGKVVWEASDVSASLELTVGDKGNCDTFNNTEAGEGMNFFNIGIGSK